MIERRHPITQYFRRWIRTGITLFNVRLNEGLSIPGDLKITGIKELDLSRF